MTTTSNGNGYGQYVSIGVASKLLQISPQSLRAYERSGLIQPVARTLCNGKHGHRRFNIEDLKRSVLGQTEAPTNGDSQGKRVVLYGRVSSAGQKASLDAQVARLLGEISLRERIDEAQIGVFREVASSFGDRKALNNLIDEVLSGKVLRIYVEHADRLSRVPALTRLVEHICKRHSVELICLDREVALDDEAASMAELIEFVTVLANRRSSKKQANRRRVVLDPEIIATLRNEVARGKSVRQMVDNLNALNVKDSKGRPLKYSSTQRLLARLDKILPPATNVENSYAKFVSEELVRKKNCWASASAIACGYQEWCKARNIEGLPALTTGKWMTSHSNVVGTSINKAGNLYYPVEMKNYANVPIGASQTKWITSIDNGLTSKPFTYNARKG